MLEAGVLSVVPAHSEQFVPTSNNDNFPKPLTSLKNVMYVKMKYDELLKECKSFSINITEKMSECVETATKDQSYGTNSEQAVSPHHD